MCFTGTTPGATYTTQVYGVTDATRAYGRYSTTAGTLTCGNANTAGTTFSVRPNFRLAFTEMDMSNIPNDLNFVNVSHPFNPGYAVLPGTNDVQVLKVEMKMRGLANIQNISQMVFGAKNTNSSHISEARLYYTEDNNTFNTNNLLGTITAGPTGNA